VFEHKFWAQFNLHVLLKLCTEVCFACFLVMVGVIFFIYFGFIDNYYCQSFALCFVGHFWHSHLLVADWEVLGEFPDCAGVRSAQYWNSTFVRHLTSWYHPRPRVLVRRRLPGQPVCWPCFIYRVDHKKCGTSLLSISSPINDRFSVFFHCHTPRTICYNVIIISHHTRTRALN